MMNNTMKKFALWIFAMLICFSLNAYDGAKLWLQSEEDAKVKVINDLNSSSIVKICIEELKSQMVDCDSIELSIVKNERINKEGFEISPKNDHYFCINATTEKGLLYGTYALIRMRKCENVRPVLENPQYDLRILNHWDNLDGTIERGYAGNSIWEWNELPDKVSIRYKEYARANASIGINGAVLNNVNASHEILSNEYLIKVKAIADVMRPYGIRVYLTAKFSSPIGFGDLDTADPLDKRVVNWWQNKVDEIYSLIPDFGGFLIKANSEGQPGPCDYGRSHAEGANMLAQVLKPHGGVVMWRAFVYAPNDPDRAKQAYSEFKPLDGRFDDNVIIQIKNGPVDFQPREPYSPLFTALDSTSTMVEFQITQEYLGHSNHLAFLAPMWKEFFDAVNPRSLKAIAGVSNIGNCDNWTGHPFAQANWYAFGRLAWNSQITSRDLAQEWLLQSGFLKAQATQNDRDKIVEMMLSSREAVVDYMMPMGLHHLFAGVHHYGPEPWYEVEGMRIDWTPRYYHKADSYGIGFDRTINGTNAVGQYPIDLAQIYNDVNRCPEIYLLWFHHLPWSYQISTGETVWNALCRHYAQGVKAISGFVDTWSELEGLVDSSLYTIVKDKLDIQMKDAKWWHDACLLYFQQYSKMEIVNGLQEPNRTLDKLKQVNLGCSMYENPTASLLDSQR